MFFCSEMYFYCLVKRSFAYRNGFIYIFSYMSFFLLYMSQKEKNTIMINAGGG